MIYDISQPLFECDLFPGDKRPVRQIRETIKSGNVCNITGIEMSVHNGTHVDAPYHFYDEGKTIDEIDLNKFVGICYVLEYNGDIGKDDAKKFIETAKNNNPGSERKILVKGDATVTLEAAEVFAEAKLDLYGNESQTVGPLSGPAAVHRVMLNEEIVLLEGIRLSKVKEGAYMLNCAPLNLSNSDGSPCRALLFDL